MDPFAVSLVDPLSWPTKEHITHAFWNFTRTDTLSNAASTSEAYWQFYRNECDRALHDGGRHVLARTHRDIVDVVRLLQERHSRISIQEKLRLKLTITHDNDEELIDRAIDLSANLLLMVNCTNIEYGFSGYQQLEWKDGSLDECIRSHFETRPVLGHEAVKLPRIFNAMNLGRIAGIEIVPTSNILDHLRLIDDDRKVYIFHHSTFLNQQSISSLLPKELIRETQRTMALLFPQSDPVVRKWYRQLPTPWSLDTQLIMCGHLKTDDRQIEKFYYWHDRLVVLKQAFDEATPQNLLQWWYDRRNGVQWWTFWVAILVLGMTLLFGFIQCLTGIMQVYAAFHPRTGD